MERRIITGLITSTSFINQIENVWDAQLLESSTARMLAGWVFEYYRKYQKCPGKEIENIFYQKLRDNKISKEIGEEIETEILPSLSKEYEENGINLNYLLDSTHQYLQEKHLEQHSQTIQTLVEQGELTEAEKTASEYKALARESGQDLDLSSETALLRVEKAFTQASSPVVKYPRQLGQFWNDQLVKGKLVALMAPEKRGKTWWLMDMAMRAARQKKKVAFFQAGDMTEDEQIMRMCIHITKKSNLEKYSGKMFQPVRDCVLNQLGTCTKEVRECDFGVFEGRTIKELRKDVTLEELKEAWKDNPDYLPCSSCKAYNYQHIGAVWLEEVNTGNALTMEQAKEAVDKFFIQNKRRFKLSSHANDTLSIKEINALLDVWERQEDFIPAIIVIDYADLLVPDNSGIEFRHQQNKIWKGLRNLSQVRDCLVVTATQADAASYEQNRLKLKNFSEDKRKYAHCTAMYGLNQDPKDREKGLKIMRINEIIKREGSFSNANEVTVIQNLERGRPYLGSFW